jgi:hypothetical protein
MTAQHRERFVYICTSITNKRTGCSIYKAIVTTNSTCKLWWQYKRVYYFLFVRKKSQNSFGAEGEIVHHFLEDEHLPFLMLLATLQSGSWINASNIPFSTVLQFLPASWVFRINSSFEKLPQKEVCRGTPRVRRLWLLKATPNNKLKRMFAVQQLFCSQRRPSPHHVKTSSPSPVHTSDAGFVFDRKHSCVPSFCCQSPHCCLIRYFVVRIWIHIIKCYTNISKWFRSHVRETLGQRFL